MKKVALIIIASAIAALVATPVGAQSDDEGGVYPPDITSQRSLDVSGFSTVCQADVPYIVYDIVPVGFVPPYEAALLTIRDSFGEVVEIHAVDSFTGTLLYPGASIDAQGDPTDWPGWKFEGDQWVPDDSDAHLRNGLTIEVEVNPTAIATVSYPPASAACADPPGTPSLDGPVDVKSATAVCSPDRSSACANPSYSSPPIAALRTPTGDLPATGSDLDLLRWAVVLLAAGLLLTAIAARRRWTANAT